MSRLDTWLVKPQKKLGAAGLLVLLVLGSLVAPLSLDMYTPAVPAMSDYFQTTPDIVNLTLVGYYLFLAIGLLVFGPLSDKYGRRVTLVGGMGTYVASSVLCALSINIWMLVVMRLIQALASGAMSATCMAIVKDAVKSEYREKMLSVMQIMFVIGPVAAPIIGAGILQFTNWRGSFWALAIISAAEFLMSLLFEETLPVEKRTQESVFGALGRLGYVGKNVAFMVFLFATGAFEIAYMAYVSVGSYVYMDMFGFSAFGYSIFFAAAALTCALGPIFWLRAGHKIGARRFTTIAIVGALLVGVLTLVIGNMSAFLFCVLFLIFAFLESAVRPYSVNVLLSQYESDAGTASALINFTRTFTGVIGMFLVMLPWSNYIVGVAMMMIIGMGISLVMWIGLLKSPLILHGIKYSEKKEELL